MGKRCSEQCLQNLADLSGQVIGALDIQPEQKIPEELKNEKF
jgi:hypothetical protein